MNEAATTSDYHWLVSPAAETYLAAAKDDGRPLLAQLQSLRKELSAERTHLILEQIELRSRARAKFRLADRLFFDRLALEQSTDDVTAAYKAERFPAGQTIADLCCGMGGDLLALAQRGTVIGIERNERLAVLAAANGRVLQEQTEKQTQTEVQVHAIDLREFDIASVAAWHIDPDRRPEGRRTTQVDLHEPSSDVWAELLRQNPRGAIKLAPAAEMTPEWEAETELEWISRDGSCRQLVVWCGELTKASGLRRATVLSGTHSLRRTIQGTPTFVSQQPSVGRYLYEPDAAILAADLVGVLANEHALAAVIPGGGYLTGDVQIADAALATFEVQEVLPFQMKRIKNLLRERGLGRLEVKKRGVDHEPEKLRRELKVPGENQATLFVTRLASGITAILARRLTTR